jgi:hypothetical protein
MQAGSSTGLRAFSMCGYTGSAGFGWRYRRGAVGEAIAVRKQGACHRKQAMNSLAHAVEATHRYAEYMDRPASLIPGANPLKVEVET